MTAFLKSVVVTVLFVIVIQLQLTNPTAGQILRIGHCPSFSALKDFEMDKVGHPKVHRKLNFLKIIICSLPLQIKYLGTWYQVERYFSFPGMGGKCWTQTYYPDPEVAGRFKLRMDYRDFVY